MTILIEDLKVGKVFRGKRFKEFFGQTNDRVILWLDLNKRLVQYDSDTVRMGRKYPTVSIGKFLRWVKEEVVNNENGRKT